MPWVDLVLRAGEQAGRVAQVLLTGRSSGGRTLVPSEQVGSSTGV